MSVLSEKYAAQALLGSTLGLRFPAAAGNVYFDLLPEPYDGTFPAIVLRRIHYSTTELEAGGGPERGNDDGDPNIYTADYYDALVSESGTTLQATMDAHDQFLEDFTACFNVRANRSLTDSHGVSQATAAGETITSDSQEAGPYQMRSGEAAILSTLTFTVKQLHRYATS